MLFVQLVYLAALTIKILNYRHPQTHLFHSVSIIIASRNEAENLPRLITMLLNQEHPDFEIIIANDRSEDGSTELLDELARQHAQLKIIHINKLPGQWTGKKYALYKAIQQASNDILLFTDADCLPRSNQWIQQMTGGECNDIRIGYSPYKTKGHLLGMLIHFETLMTAWQYLGWALWKWPYMAVGRNMAIRKEVYDLNFLNKIKHLEGGDDDLMLAHLAKQHKVAVNFQKEAQTFSFPEKNWCNYFKQKTRHLSAGKHYRQKEKTVLSFYMLSYVMSWGLFVWLLANPSVPDHLILAFGIKSVAYYIMMYVVSRQFNNNFRIWALPLIDACYVCSVVIVTVRLLFSKKPVWK